MKLAAMAVLGPRIPFWDVGGARKLSGEPSHGVFRLRGEAMLLKTIMFMAASLFLLEGFVFSLFPEQALRMLREAEPRALQVAGMIETVLAASLLASLYFQSA